MISADFRRGERAAREKMLARVHQMIDARLAWASSPEGRTALGPGSPTIPGLQDLYAMRDYIVALETKST